MTLFDISLTIAEDLPVWPGDPKIELKKISKIEDGEEANVTHISACVHIGTHWHPCGCPGAFSGQRANRGKPAAGSVGRGSFRG